MRSVSSSLSEAFGAGCFGGLVNSAIVWLSGHYHLTARMGVKLAPSMTPPWLYPRIVWGGIWGFLFLFPLWRGSVLRRGILLSLVPTLLHLFNILPYHPHKGFMGTDVRTMAPVFVCNALWGVAAALWMRMSGD